MTEPNKEQDVQYLSKKLQHPLLHDLKVSQHTIKSLQEALLVAEQREQGMCIFNLAGVDAIVRLLQSVCFCVCVCLCLCVQWELFLNCYDLGIEAYETIKLQKPVEKIVSF